MQYCYNLQKRTSTPAWLSPPRAGDYWYIIIIMAFYWQFFSTTLSTAFESSGSTITFKLWLGKSLQVSTDFSVKSTKQL